MKRFLIAAFVLVGLAGSSDANPLRKLKQRIQSRHTNCQQKVVCQVAAPVVGKVADEPAVVAAAQVEATAKKPGAVFCIAVRAKLRQEFRAKGYGLLESIRMANAASDEVIAGLIADAEKMSGVKVVGTAIGDGKIIDAIIGFFKSPQGQALLDALIKLLLGLFI